MRAMHKLHLQRFMPELGELDAYKDINSLLQLGVAYHHGGMLPVLREYVELCFQQKLVKLVFATETLAVGVNMPARTVVFSQLDKPNDGDLPGHRPLRPDEFWQMAGRAGRRGWMSLATSSTHRRSASAGCARCEPARAPRDANRTDAPARSRSSSSTTRLCCAIGARLRRGGAHATLRADGNRRERDALSAELAAPTRRRAAPVRAAAAPRWRRRRRGSPR